LSPRFLHNIFDYRLFIEARQVGCGSIEICPELTTTSWKNDNNKFTMATHFHFRTLTFAARSNNTICLHFKLQKKESGTIVGSLLVSRTLRLHSWGLSGLGALLREST
jgi:hypothetical protein